MLWAKRFWEKPFALGGCNEKFVNGNCEKREEDGLRRDELRNVVVAKMERETEMEEGERQVNQENRREEKERHP